MSILFLTSKVQITQDEYNTLLKCSKAEADDFISNIANKSPYPPAGYGFFSSRFFEVNGNYFVAWKHMRSCD